MSEYNNSSHDLLEIAQPTLPLEESRSKKKCITTEVMQFYLNNASKTKDKVDHLAAEVNQRQDKMRFMNDLLAEINILTDDKNGLDISKNTELLQKFQLARELGIKIKENQVKFNGIERDRLIENVHLATDNWDKENRFQIQKMEILVKELDRLMLLLKDTDRKEDQARRPMAAGIRGG